MRLMILSIAICLFISCDNSNGRKDVRSIEIFRDTKIWELARVAATEDMDEFSKVIQKLKADLNVQEMEFGFTLLMWCVKMEKYEMAEMLLQNGADPNVRSKNGKTAVFYATEYSWLDDDADEDSKYVELLLKYGADPNVPYKGDGKSNVIDKGTSPLIHAASRSLEKVKALVNAGANINYSTKRNWTAANQALLNIKVDIAHYLIVENKADITQPYYYYYTATDSVNLSDKRYPVELLRDWVFEVGSEKHRIKMQIVKEFKRQGVDYGSTSPSLVTLNHIKKLYPESWEEYLSKY